jgi:hypothetical protein
MKPDQTNLLHIYIRNHEAAAAGGLELVRRCSKANQNSAFAPELQQLTMQIRSDRTALQDICRTLGVKLSAVERVVAIVGVTVGRLKTNGRIFRYSPLSRIFELEALAAGVMAKLRLWQSLSFLTDVDTRLDEDALLRHVANAKSQLDTIGRLHATAVEAAFK